MSHSGIKQHGFLVLTREPFPRPGFERWKSAPLSKKEAASRTSSSVPTVRG